MAEPMLIGSPPPPIRRDRMVHAWIAASTVSWLGTSAWNVALAWVAATRFDPAAAGVVVAVSTLPQALVTTLGGVIADRFDTRRVLISAQLGNAATMVAGAALWGRLDPWPLLLCLGVLFGLITGLSQPAGATLGRQLVTTADLPTVSGWNQLATRLARLAGAPLGAWLVTRYDLPAVMIVNAISFVVIAAALGFLVRTRYRIHQATPDGWWASTRDALTYLRRDRAAALFVLGLCGLNVFSTPLITLGVPLRITASGWPATVLGTAEAVFSGAALLGSVLSLKVRPRNLTVSAFAMLAGQGASYALVALDHPAALTAAMAVIGLTGGAASVWLSAEFARIVAPAYLGRIAALSTLGDLLLIPLATPAFGALTDHVTINLSPIMLAIPMTAWCSWLASRPALRVHRQTTEQPAPPTNEADKDPGSTPTPRHQLLSDRDDTDTRPLIRHVEVLPPLQPRTTGSYSRHLW